MLSPIVVRCTGKLLTVSVLNTVKKKFSSFKVHLNSQQIQKTVKAVKMEFKSAFNITIKAMIKMKE